MKTILLSAGHSNVDPGVTAVVLAADGKSGRLLREADIAVSFRNKVSFYLSQAKIEHRLDGVGTQNLPLDQAARIARTVNIALEFHCNGVVNEQANGVEVFAGPKDMKLAAELSAAIAKALNLKDRGAKPENAGHHSKLAFVGAGGLIVELFFLSNPNDRAQYEARSWLAAKAVADIVIARATQ